MKIGHLSIKTPIFLAPMAGVTDFPFRCLCKEFGASIVYSEFVSAHGIIRENIKTLNMIKFSDFERPIGIQIFGDSPDVMSNAARLVVDNFNPDIIDINYGCPVPKVTKRGAGSAALKDLCLMDDITSAVVESVPEVPVTVKMRAGWDSQSIVVPEVGERLENIGIKAITLHPRTTKQSYKGDADWSLIKLLKESTNIPVIGNGDIKTPEDVIRMFEKTSCDGVMIGRSSLGNPWFFKQAVALFEGKKIEGEPTLEDKVNCCRQHFIKMIEWHGERIAVNLMKKHFGWYIRGFQKSSTIRKALVSAQNQDTIISILDAIV
ncbi:MAG: tRNA dihydrouridine synthase DusB [Candidatus Marinimicrobia bacterium]|nr:tRNA dihydrouridine synthase DusB [Candidatus Neomarinimicrobiota bacterium]